MGATMTQSRSRQGGFTIIETMIAITIMGIGLMTLIAAFATAVTATQNAQENLIARQKTLEALESVYTARNTQQISFAQIANVSSGGIFLDGPTQLLCPGTNGLAGTAAFGGYTGDGACPANGPCAAGPQCLVLPGPDGILGTPDDVGMSLANFTRQIQIASVLESDGVTVNPNLKQITVTVNYWAAGSTLQHTYTVTALISSYR
jgi:prepilin-type N-terminal cleavage/methylation domain-containing protein